MSLVPLVEMATVRVRNVTAYRKPSHRNTETALTVHNTTVAGTPIRGQTCASIALRLDATESLVDSNTCLRIKANLSVIEVLGKELY